MKSIKILKAEIDGVIYELTNDEFETKSKNLYTVIIGGNATGKSRLLVNLLQAFRFASNKRLKRNSTNYEIQIESNNEKYNLKSFWDDSPSSITEINLVCISNSVYDKFPHEVSSDKNYSYIGLKQVGIRDSRRSAVYDLIDKIHENIDNELFINKATTLFNFLGIEPKLRLNLRLSFSAQSRKRNDLFENSQSINSLREYLIDISTKGFYRNQNKRIKAWAENKTFLRGFQKFIKSEFKDLNTASNYENLSYEINFKDLEKSKDFINEYKYFSALRRLNILTYRDITLDKNKIKYDILDSSTGELGLLMTFLRAIPDIKSKSLIFIDEPEISLHPSWQMKYMELLQTFMKGFEGCHIFIATHSHLLLSDLKEHWSSLVVLKNTKGKIISELKPYSPFGWSAESILYDVFGVATTRNHYFEYDIKELINLISKKSKNIKQIKKHIERFKEYDLKKSDPLNLIIKDAEKYISNAK